MKSLKIAGLCFASMLVMGMALARTAAAIPALWLVCLEGTEKIPLTKYNDNQCKEFSGVGLTGRWQSLGLSPGQSDTVRILGFTLRLTDAGAPLGSTTIRCNSLRGWGLVENGGKGKIFTAEVENAEANCRSTEKGCKETKVKKMVAVNLPWTIEAVEEAGKFLGKLVKGTGGEPGWTVTCETTVGLEASDTCTIPKEKPEHVFAENQVTGGMLLVLGEFAKRTKANCSVGGTERGEVEGKIAILLAKGMALSLRSF